MADKKDDHDVVPVLWEDNYFSLLPGERKEVTATYRVRDLGNAPAFLAVEGWNSPLLKVPIMTRRKR